MSDAEKILACVLKVGFGFKSFHKYGKNVVKNSGFHYVINSAQVHFVWEVILLELSHDLPIAPSIHGHPPEVGPSEFLLAFSAGLKSVRVLRLKASLQYNLI